MAHKCPSRCHKCPNMHGEVMPDCMGTAALAIGPYDMSHCTCSSHSERDRLAYLETQVKELKAKVLMFEKRLSA